MDRRVPPRIPLVNKKLCVVMLVIPILLVLAACGGDRQALGEQNADGPKEQREGNAGTRTEETGAAAADAQRHSKAGAAHRGSAAGGDSIGKVTLEISGDPGTGFSGTCALGEEKKELDGQVPERFVYELDGRRLRCKIRTEGADGATLKTVFTAGNAHSIQQTDTRGATISLVYSEGSLSSSTVSSSGATSASSSSSSVSSYSSSEGDR